MILTLVRQGLLFSLVFDYFRAEEGEKAVRSQSHVQDIDEGVEAMLAITSAANRSSLADFR